MKGEAAAQMLLSLSYKEQNSRLTVTILKCKNLPAMDLNGYSGEKTRRKGNTMVLLTRCHVAVRRKRKKGPGGTYNFFAFFGPRVG